MQKFKSIMLIDDDFVTNLLNEKILSKQQAADEIIKYTNAALALHQIKTNAENLLFNNLPEMIFLDINMPEMDGWSFLDELIKITGIDFKKLKVILLSSSIDINDIQKSISYTVVTNFISKPLTADKLKSLKTLENPTFRFESKNNFEIADQDATNFL